MTNTNKCFILRNFISKYSVNLLNQWTLANCNREIFEDAKMDTFNAATRFTTRAANESIAPNINYPVSAFIIKQKIIDHFGLEGYKSPPSYSHGIVNGIGYGGGDIVEHIDPVYYSGTKTVHFNIITQQADTGGHIIVDGVKYNDLTPQDLMIYQVSEVYHEVTRTEGNTPRILWVFGFCLDDKKIKEIFL